MKNISKIRQSNLFEHFLSTLKFLAISQVARVVCLLISEGQEWPCKVFPRDVKQFSEFCYEIW